MIEATSPSSGLSQTEMVKDFLNKMQTTEKKIDTLVSNNTGKTTDDNLQSFIDTTAHTTLNPHGAINTDSDIVKQVMEDAEKNNITNISDYENKPLLSAEEISDLLDDMIDGAKERTIEENETLQEQTKTPGTVQKLLDALEVERKSVVNHVPLNVVA